MSILRRLGFIAVAGGAAIWMEVQRRWNANVVQALRSDPALFCEVRELEREYESLVNLLKDEISSELPGPIEDWRWILSRQQAVRDRWWADVWRLRCGRAVSPGEVARVRTDLAAITRRVRSAIDRERLDEVVTKLNSESKEDN